MESLTTAVFPEVEYQDRIHGVKHPKQAVRQILMGLHEKLEILDIRELYRKHKGKRALIGIET